MTEIRIKKAKELTGFSVSHIYKNWVMWKEKFGVKVWRKGLLSPEREQRIREGKIIDTRPLIFEEKSLLRFVELNRQEVK